MTTKAVYKDSIDSLKIIQRHQRSHETEAETHFWPHFWRYSDVTWTALFSEKKRSFREPFSSSNWFYWEDQKQVFTRCNCRYSATACQLYLLSSQFLIVLVRCASNSRINHWAKTHIRIDRLRRAQYQIMARLINNPPRPFVVGGLVRWPWRHRRRSCALSVVASTCHVISIKHFRVARVLVGLIPLLQAPKHANVLGVVVAR